MRSLDETDREIIALLQYDGQTEIVITGGDVVTHSRVAPPHGLSAAGLPRKSEWPR